MGESFDEPGVAGVTISGPSGSGKSMLAQHWVAGLPPSVDARTVLCSRTLAATPLGCLRPLLDALDPRGQPVAAAAAEWVLRSAAARAELLLFVDDAQFVDPVTARVLRRLYQQEVVAVLLTVRTGEPVPAALAELTRDERMRTIDLGPLDGLAVTEMLEMELRGPVDPALVAAALVASGGNPLFVRELLIANQASETIRFEDRWTLVRPLEASTLLANMIERRVGALGPDGRRALRLVAVTGTIAADLLGSLAGDEAVEELESAGLIETMDLPGKLRYRSVHPLFAEVALAGTPIIERRALGGVLADGLSALEAPSDAAFLDVLRWRLGSFDPVAPADLERGVSLARQQRDLGLAATCARLLWRHSGTPEAAVSLADALFTLQDRASLVEADSVLVRAQATLEPGDPRLVEVLATRSLILGVGLGRVEEATGLAALVHSSATDPSESTRLTMAVAATHIFTGWPELGLAALATIDYAREPLGETYWLSGLWFAGRIAELHDRLRTVPAAERMPFATSLEAACLLFLGRLEEAIRLAGACLVDASRAGQPDVGAQLTSGLTLGTASLMRGRSADAVRQLRSVLPAGAGLLLAAAPLGMLVGAAALSGDLSQAEEALAEVEAIDPGLTDTDEAAADSWATYAVAPGRVHLALARGQTTHEAEMILRSALAAMGRKGQRLNEAWMLHELACLGAAGRTDATRLAELQSQVGGELVARWAEHAEAIASRDAAALLSVARALGDIGDVQGALHASWSSWLCALEDGRVGLAADARDLLTDLAAATDWDPLFLPPPAALRSLTARERQVAQLAAAGHPSKQIAEQLGLSRRTVDNNLHRVFLKLGISSRRELRDRV